MSTPRTPSAHPQEPRQRTQEPRPLQVSAEMALALTLASLTAYDDGHVEHFESDDGFAVDPDWEGM